MDCGIDAPVTAARGIQSAGRLYDLRRTVPTDWLQDHCVVSAEGNGGAGIAPSVSWRRRSLLFANFQHHVNRGPVDVLGRQLGYASCEFVRHKITNKPIGA